MKHLEIEGLGYRRGDFSLELSLSLERGQTGVIVGPSGCGKTTLLRCIAGLERPDKGRIQLGGKDIGGLAPERRHVGFMFQDLALFDHLDGRRNLEFGLKLAKADPLERQAITARLAKTLKIEALLDRKPLTMSGGERQRLAFARAIAMRPKLLLMDEPLSSLDAPLRKELRSYLRTMLKQENITALHVTHDVEEALDLGDRLFIMNSGRVVAEGDPGEIFENPPDAWCVRFLGLGGLVPLDKPEFDPGQGLWSSPFGEFSLQRPEKPDLSDQWYCYIPPVALREDGFAASERNFRESNFSEGNPSEGSYSEGKPSRGSFAADTLKAIVERKARRNGLYRIRLRLLKNSRSGGQKPFAKQLGNDDPVMELDQSWDPGLKEDSLACFAIDPALCRVLPDVAIKTGGP